MTETAHVQQDNALACVQYNQSKEKPNQPSMTPKAPQRLHVVPAVSDRHLQRCRSGLEAHQRKMKLMQERRAAVGALARLLEQC